MKAALRLLLASLPVCALLLPLFTRPSALNAAPSPQAPGVLYCASDDGRRMFCPMNTSGGVQLYRQRSDAACLFGQTWGYDKRGVWVDRGCRAEFSPGHTGGPEGPGWPGWGEKYNVYCASDDGGRNRCPVDTHGGVRLVRQRSGAPCNYGSTWGWDKHGIWVDRGCRADFEIGQSGWKPPQQQVVYCASDDMRRKNCPIDTHGGARIIRQRSDADCVYGRTWGYDSRGIWVDRGCRADFEVGIRH